MASKHRFRNKYTLQVRERDHLPPHVHVWGAGYDVIVDLLTLESIGRWPAGLRDEAMAYIAAHQDELIEEWNKWHA